MKQWNLLTQYFACIFVKCVKHCIGKRTNDGGIEFRIIEEMKTRHR